MLKICQMSVSWTVHWNKGAGVFNLTFKYLEYQQQKYIKNNASRSDSGLRNDISISLSLGSFGFYRKDDPDGFIGSLVKYHENPETKLWVERSWRIQCFAGTLHWIFL